jgi:hypothetical protein
LGAHSTLQKSNIRFELKEIAGKKPEWQVSKTGLASGMHGAFLENQENGHSNSR